MAPPMPSAGVPLLMRLRWQAVISTLIHDHLMIRRGKSAQRLELRGWWSRTFGCTWSMLELASRHRICIADMIADILYRKHFVSIALPEESKLLSWLLAAA